jgi:hypothetical protein
MPNMSIKQALREADTVTKFLGDPWGFEKKITKREAKIIVANHGLDLSATADDDLSDIWEWMNGARDQAVCFFSRGRFSGISKFEIWEHAGNCVGWQEDPTGCSCGILLKLVNS